MAGRLCTSLCHGDRGSNKLCNMMDDLDDPSSSDVDDRNEDDANSASTGEQVGQIEQV